MAINYTELKGILEKKANMAINHLDELKCFVPEFKTVLDSVLYISETLNDLKFLDTECPDCKKTKEYKETKQKLSAREIEGLNSSFQKEYKSFDGITRNPNRLVLFYSDGCEPCQHLKPLLEKLSVDENIELELVSVDTPLATRHAEEYGVRGWPTLFILRDNIIVESGSGYDLTVSEEMNLQRYLEHIKRFI